MATRNILILPGLLFSLLLSSSAVDEPPASKNKFEALLKIIDESNSPKQLVENIKKMHGTENSSESIHHLSQTSPATNDLVSGPTVSSQKLEEVKDKLLSNIDNYISEIGRAVPEEMALNLNLTKNDLEIAPKKSEDEKHGKSNILFLEKSVTHLSPDHSEKPARHYFRKNIFLDRKKNEVPNIVDSLDFGTKALKENDDYDLREGKLENQFENRTKQLILPDLNMLEVLKEKYNNMLAIGSNLDDNMDEIDKHTPDSPKTLLSTPSKKNFDLLQDLEGQISTLEERVYNTTPQVKKSAANFKRPMENVDVQLFPEYLPHRDPSDDSMLPSIIPNRFSGVQNEADFKEMLRSKTNLHAIPSSVQKDLVKEVMRFHLFKNDEGKTQKPKVDIRSGIQYTLDKIKTGTNTMKKLQISSSKGTIVDQAKKLVEQMTKSNNIINSLKDMYKQKEITKVVNKTKKYKKMKIQKIINKTWWEGENVCNEEGVIIVDDPRSTGLLIHPQKWFELSRNQLPIDFDYGLYDNVDFDDESEQFNVKNFQKFVMKNNKEVRYEYEFWSQDNRVFRTEYKNTHLLKPVISRQGETKEVSLAPSDGKEDGKVQSVQSPGEKEQVLNQTSTTETEIDNLFASFYNRGFNTTRPENNITIEDKNMYDEPSRTDFIEKIFEGKLKLRERARQRMVDMVRSKLSDTQVEVNRDKNFTYFDLTMKPKEKTKYHLADMVESPDRIDYRKFLMFNDLDYNDLDQIFFQPHEVSNDVIEKKTTCKEMDDYTYECVSVIAMSGLIHIYSKTYNCCPGFFRKGRQMHCSKEDMKSIIDTLRILKNNDFLHVISISKLNNIIIGNVTLFSPPDNVLLKLFKTTGGTKKNRMSTNKAFTMKEIGLNHIVHGFVDINKLRNNDLIKPYLKNSYIRINIYNPSKRWKNKNSSMKNKLITVNCVPIVNGNIHAYGGIIHVTAGIIPPVTLTIRNLILRSTKTQFMTRLFRDDKFSKVISRRKPFTLLLPTELSLIKVQDQVIKTLLAKDNCAVKIVRHWIIPDIVCLSAIQGRSTIRNLDNEEFEFNQEGTNYYSVNGARIIKSVLGTNGIIHLVDTMLVPDSGLKVINVMKKYKLTAFLKLINVFKDMEEEYDSRVNNTFFIPNNEAIQEAWKLFLDDDQDGASTYYLLNYYQAPGIRSTNWFINNHMIPTLSETKARVNYYVEKEVKVMKDKFNHTKTFPMQFTSTFNCINIVIADIKCCEGIVHVINKFKHPPVLTIGQIINKYDRYSMVRKILKGTPIGQILFNKTEHLTFFIPTNHVMKQLTKNNLQALSIDKQKADEVFRTHTLPDVLCCSGIRREKSDNRDAVYDLTNDTFDIPGEISIHDVYYRTLSDELLEIRKYEGWIVVGQYSVITRCDILATNGVIHEISEVILPPSLEVPLNIEFGRINYNV